MEIWILIVAAGSGYLAQYWQSSHKSEEAPIDIADDEDNDHSRSSSRTRPSKRSYYHSLSSRRRRRMKGLSNQNWHESKFNQGVVGKMTGGCVRNLYVSVDDDKGSHAAQAWHNCSNMPTQFEKRPDATCSRSTYGIRSLHIPSKCPAQNSLNGFWPQQCCGLDFSQGNHEGSGLPSEKVPSMLPEAFLDGWGCCMSSLYFSHCTVNSAIVDKSGFMLQEGSPTKCIYEVFDNNMVNGEGQDHEGVSSSSTRKVRPHQSTGRSRSSTKRRRSRAICRPMTSSGSCLSVELVDAYSQEVAEGHTHNSLACEQPFRGLGQSSCKDGYDSEGSGNYLSEENCGLLLSPSKMALSILNKNQKSESSVEKKEMGCDLKRSYHPCCLPVQSSRCGQELPRRECPTFLGGGDDSELQGSGDNLLKLLLFNFGVGIGMMFVIMSNKHCTNQIFKPLEEALCLLKDLEGEVQGRKKLRFEFYNRRKDRTENLLAGQGDDVINILRRIVELVEQVRVSSFKDLVSVSSADYRHSKERARLEAELEAELEKMEINLSIGDVSEFCPRYSGVIEDDLKIGELVQGELSTRGIPCDVEADSDDCDLSYEDIHFGNCAVPPVELATRLHEVLEARQDKKILELEAELKQLDSRLQAKEMEFQVWRQRASHLLEDSAFESGSGFGTKGGCMKTADTTKKVLSSSKQERKHSFSAGMCHSEIVSPVCVACKAPFSRNHTNKAGSLHWKGPQPRACLGYKADNEVCEEFFQLWSNTATETPSSHNGLLTGPHLEHELVSSTNDATNDTLANTPCTLKAMDKHTVAHHHLEDKLEGKTEMEASSRNNHSNLLCKGHLNVDEDGEGMPLGHEKLAICAQDVIDIFESHGQFGRVLDWTISEDSSYSSELDEQFGQLLIKRIIEKSKRGSAIVELAHSVMASLEIDEAEMET